MTEREWIEKVAPDAVKAMNKFGYLASVLIAQTCLETGYGSGSGCEVLVRWNNVLGMKADLLNDTWRAAYWDGRAASKRTPEYYGNWTQITDSFRVYTSIHDCLFDYCQFMRDSRYSVGGRYKYRDVLTIKDPETLIKTVSARGYATDPRYAASVMAIIRKHGLTKYDSQKGTATMQKPTIIDRIAQNASQVPAHNANAHQYIAVHYLGVEGENFDLYGGGYGGHFYVSKDGHIYQAAKVTDKLWHVGASSGFSYKHPMARNSNTIGIECGTYKQGGKWFFTEATQEACARLVAWLMSDLNIPFDHVLRHGDITTKHCPAPYIDYEGQGTNWTWAQFKKRVASYIQGNTSEILKRGDKGDAVKALQKDLTALGYAPSGGTDGDYGPGTEAAVKSLQQAFGLAPDGIAGPKTLAKIKEVRKMIKNSKKRPDWTKAQQDEAMRSVYRELKAGGWSYGDSHVLPPGQDHFISCDRGIMRALWDLGLTDQRAGGETTGTMGAYLVKHGYIENKNINDIRDSDIVLFRHKDSAGMDWKGHAYYCVKRRGATVDKFDWGDDWRIGAQQPFRGVPISEWPHRTFYASYRLPESTPDSDKTCLIKAGQQHSINYTGVRIKVDGDCGPETRKNLVRCLQIAANRDWGAGLSIDGIIGPRTRAAFAGHYIERGETQQMVTAVEIIMYAKGKNPGGVENPGHFGPGLEAALGKKHIDGAEILALVG